MTDVRADIAAAGLDPDAVEALVRAALAEDLQGGEDVTTVATVPEGQRCRADLVARRPGVVAGLAVAGLVVEIVSDGDARYEPRVADGDVVGAGEVLATVRGRTRDVLTAERTALNLLGRLCGVATMTRRWVEAVEGSGVAVRDTRKTTPLLRSLEKYAVRCGGGQNHRVSLSDAALVKDNHVIAAGGVAAAFDAVRRRFPDLPVEVEVDTVEQAVEAVEAGAELILLDNMPPAVLREAVRAVGGRARLEASGGLTLADAPEVAATGVDYIAVGALTHSAPVLDIGLDLHADPDLRRPDHRAEHRAR